MSLTVVVGSGVLALVLLLLLLLCLRVVGHQSFRRIDGVFSIVGFASTGEAEVNQSSLSIRHSEYRGRGSKGRVSSPSVAGGSALEPTTTILGRWSAYPRRCLLALHYCCPTMCTVALLLRLPFWALPPPCWGLIFAMPYRVLCSDVPRHAAPRFALPFLALPCLALSCLALPCLALPCLALPCLRTSTKISPNSAFAGRKRSPKINYEVLDQLMNGDGSIKRIKGERSAVRTLDPLRALIIHLGRARARACISVVLFLCCFGFLLSYPAQLSALPLGWFVWLSGFRPGTLHRAFR